MTRSHSIVGVLLGKSSSWKSSALLHLLHHRHHYRRRLCVCVFYIHFSLICASMPLCAFRMLVRQSEREFNKSTNTQQQIYLSLCTTHHLSLSFSFSLLTILRVFYSYFLFNQKSKDSCGNTNTTILNRSFTFKSSWLILFHFFNTEIDSCNSNNNLYTSSCSVLSRLDFSFYQHVYLCFKAFFPLIEQLLWMKVLTLYFSFA
jgi:hypothetical protein